MDFIFFLVVYFFVVANFFIIYSCILWNISQDLSSVGGGATDSDGETERSSWVYILLLFDIALLLASGRWLWDEVTWERLRLCSKEERRKLAQADLDAFTLEKLGER